MTLKELKSQLKEAWIHGEGYDYDEMFVVCYKNGTVLDTREANEKLPMTGIIGIEFHGSNATCCAGTII